MGKGGKRRLTLKRLGERHPRLKPIPRVLYEDAATNVPSTPYYDALNRRVDEIVAKARAVAKEPEIHILVAGDGALVYPNRIVWLPWVMGAVAYICARRRPPLKVSSACCRPCTWATTSTAACCTSRWRSEEPAGRQVLHFISGVSWTFQWHHAIPYARASKPFIDLART